MQRVGGSRYLLEGGQRAPPPLEHVEKVDRGRNVDEEVAEDDRGAHVQLQGRVLVAARRRERHPARVDGVSTRVQGSGAGEGVKRAGEGFRRG